MSLLRSVVKLGRPYTCTVIQRCVSRQDTVLDGVCRLHTSSTLQSTSFINSIYINKLYEDETEKKKNIPKSFNFADDDQRIGGEYFPTADVYETLYGGVKFEDLPYVYIISTRQNTKAGAYIGADSKGICMQTGGKVGFKHCKKKTNVCGQTVGFAMGLDLTKKGYMNVRVILKGFGQGRLPALKGMQLAGVNIVSIKDSTFPDVANRPRAARRF